MLIWIAVIEDMPVDDHIHSKLRRIFHSLPDLVDCIRTISLGLIGVHCQTDRIDTIVVPKGLECVLIDILRKPCNAMGADTLQLELRTMAVFQIRSGYMKRPMPFHWSDPCCLCRSGQLITYRSRNICRPRRSDARLTLLLCRISAGNFCQNRPR